MNTNAKRKRKRKRKSSFSWTHFLSSPRGVAIVLASLVLVGTGWMLLPKSSKPIENEKTNILATWKEMDNELVKETTTSAIDRYAIINERLKLADAIVEHPQSTPEDNEWSEQIRLECLSGLLVYQFRQGIDMKETEAKLRQSIDQHAESTAIQLRTRAKVGQTILEAVDYLNSPQSSTVQKLQELFIQSIKDVDECLTAGTSTPIAWFQINNILGLMRDYMEPEQLAKVYHDCGLVMKQSSNNRLRLLGTQTYDRSVHLNFNPESMWTSLQTPGNEATVVDYISRTSKDTKLSGTHFITCLTLVERLKQFGYMEEAEKALSNLSTCVQDISSPVLRDIVDERIKGFENREMALNKKFDFDIPDINGKSVQATLQENKKPIVLIFFSSDKRQIESTLRVTSVLPEFQERVHFVLIDTNPLVKRAKGQFDVLRGTNSTYVGYQDAADIRKSFSVPFTPFIVLLDHNQTVIDIHVAPEEILDSLIKNSLLKD